MVSLPHIQRGNPIASSTMSDASSSAVPVAPAVGPQSEGTALPKKQPSCKICCACPQERRVRDECTIFNGHDRCTEEIEGFYRCLLREGFSDDEVNRLRSNVRKF